MDAETAYQQWRERIEALGLDPDQECRKEYWFAEYAQTHRPTDAREPSVIFIPTPGASCALAWNVAV